MINHVSIGVRDLARAKRFYDAALKPPGYACLSPGEGSLGYGRDRVAFWLTVVEHPVPDDEKSVCISVLPRRRARILRSPRGRGLWSAHLAGAVAGPTDIPDDTDSGDARDPSRVAPRPGRNARQRRSSP